jgi:uncharacterized membrane protein (UPF0127 family)
MVKKNIYLLSVILFLFVLTILITVLIFMPNKKIKKVCINDNCFKVEIADSQREWSKGLMNRKSLPEDSGMLFIFDKEGLHSFWMKNTLIPLDIIWINGNKEIIYIEKEAQPCKAEKCQNYSSGQKSRYVLEINGGLADKLKIRAGDKLLMDF